MRYATLLALGTLVTLIALACGGEGDDLLPSATFTPPPAADATAEAATPTPGTITLPIEPAPGAVTKVTYAPGEEIEGIRPGPAGIAPPDGAVFFMDTETGEIEGWYVTDGDFDWSSCGVRGDNRFVTCSSGIGENTTEYLIDRESGEIYQWNPDEIGILATWPSGLVFEEADPSGAEPTRHFTITDVALQTRSTFDLPNTTRRSITESIMLTPYVVLPDESGLAILVDRRLYLVDIGSGSSQLISEIPETLILTSIQVTPTREGFSATLSSVPEKKDGIVAVQTTVVRRYSGEGELISEGPPDGGGGLFSPNGKLVARGGSLRVDSVPILAIGSRIDWPVVVVADADTGEPRFRVRGAALCYGDIGSGEAGSGRRRWLADSSGILVATKSGFRIVEVVEPALRLAPLANANQFLPFFEPSPDDPDLFAVGSNEFVPEGEGGGLLGDLILVDAHGNSLREVVLAPTAGGLGHLPPWGSSGSEVRFNIPHPDHHGAGDCGVGVTPPPKIEFPPFDDDIHLMVAADGDCLNLRDLPVTAATVITCLPDDTSVTVTEVSLTEVPGYFSSLEPFVISVSYSDGDEWAHVRTDTGQEGWVSSEFLDWAE